MTSGGQVQHFIEHTKQIATLHSDVKTTLQNLKRWQNAFAQALMQVHFHVEGFVPEASILSQTKQLEQKIHEHIQQWNVHWQTFKAAHTISDAFNDQVMFLVFGKFNAGKSSLCNLLAACFQQQGQTVRYFYVQDEQIIYNDSRLREGATETTAQLQGVCLGEKLILLDTPGLHSGTLENAALTQKFIDSADGVLWLTSSTSPGQVQELDALARELKRQKPLFPIITRSDQVEEDEVDGDICTVLCNKNVQQRALQEADVFARAKDKLHEMQVEISLLKLPVSVSTQMAREANMTQQAMSDAGFEQLFAALSTLIAPALVYKQRKPAEMFLHFLQEHVIDSFKDYIKLDLEKIKLEIVQAKHQLLTQQTQLAEAVWRSVLPELPVLLEQHAATQAIDDVIETLNQWLHQAFTEQGLVILKGYDLKIKPRFNLNISKQISYDTHAGAVVYERLYTELTRQMNECIKAYTAELLESCEAQLASLNQSIDVFEMCIDTHETQLKQLSTELRT